MGGEQSRNERSFCQRVALRELPAVTMNDIVQMLESDFKERKMI